MKTTSDNKQFIYKSSARFHQTGLAHVFIDQTIKYIDEAESLKLI
jgi:hypothetical protein